MSKDLIERLRQDHSDAGAYNTMQEAADLIEAQQKRIRHLQMALADTEALEIGTSERLAAAQAQLKVMREALEKIVNFSHWDADVRAEERWQYAVDALALPQDGSALQAAIEAAQKKSCIGRAMGQEMQQDGDAEVGRDTDPEQAGYWCVICGRYLRADDGVIVHDDIPHPLSMTFEETMQ